MTSLHTAATTALPAAGARVLERLGAQACRAMPLRPSSASPGPAPAWLARYRAPAVRASRALLRRSDLGTLLATAAAAAVTAGLTGIAVAALACRRRAAGAAEPATVRAPAGLAATIATVSAAHGDNAPGYITVVATTLRRALAAVSAGNGQPQGDGTPVYLVVLRGQFMALSAPPGVPLPRGSCLCVVLDRASLTVLDITISRQPPAVTVAGLGTPVDLGPGRG